MYIQQNFISLFINILYSIPTLFSFQNLQEINISWCHLITENGVEALARGCKHLRKFCSKGCKQVNDNAITCLAKYCPNLMVLNLHSCEVSANNSQFQFEIISNLYSLFQTITDSSIRQIASNCHNLQKLCVSKCAELTDLSLMALSQNNPYLNTLEVSGCRNFTDLGFQALGKNCKYLERMDLEECNQITDLTLAHLATGCPSLEKLVGGNTTLPAKRIDFNILLCFFAVSIAL